MRKVLCAGCGELIGGGSLCRRCEAQLTQSDLSWQDDSEKEPMELTFNLELTKEELDAMERAVKKREISQNKVAERIGVTQPVVCRWINSLDSLWSRYRSLRWQRLRSSRRLATNPAGEQKTYPEHAEDLEITLNSFIWRMRRYGEKDPRVWVKGNVSQGQSLDVTGTAKANWGGLTNRNRDHNLDRIPEPTDYERNLYYRRGNHA
jgi:predicted XRE-type DNA-binding protein